MSSDSNSKFKLVGQRPDVWATSWFQNTVYVLELSGVPQIRCSD
jgi:hypothetical protein